MVQREYMKNLKTETLFLAIASIFVIIFVLDIAFENTQAKAMNYDEEGIVEETIALDEKILEIENTKSDISVDIEDVQIKEAPTESDFNVYEAKDFSFEYPSGWFVTEIQSKFNSYVQILNYEMSDVKGGHDVQNEYFKVEIVKLENPNDLSLRDWVDNFIENQDYKTEVLEERNMSVGGRDIIYQIEEIVPMNIIHPVAFIKVGNSIFVINSGMAKGFDDVFDWVLESLEFRNNNL